MSIEVGKPFPNTTFNYVQYIPESADVTACGRPGPLNTEKEWAGKTVVLVGVPGAFTRKFLSLCDMESELRCSYLPGEPYPTLCGNDLRVQEEGGRRGHRCFQRSFRGQSSFF